MPSSGQDAERQGVAAVERALAILGAFRPEDGALSLAALAARTGFYKSTLLRLLASLERFRCVERRPDGAWAPGPMLFHWGRLYQRGSQLESVVPPALAALVATTGESASFFVREANQRLCLFRADSPRPVRDHIRPGDRLPLHQGAAGRALLAAAPGVIVSLGERDPELAAVAAPVFGAGGALAGALAVSGPRPRLVAALEHLKSTVGEAAAALTRRLGGDLQA